MEPTSPRLPPGEVLDVVGVGFGPSNLALAVAIAEHNQEPKHRTLTARFLERQHRFGWHRGMLIDDATMQVSFLKDLVTLRNPTSPFSFLAYLHAHDRLLDFINYGSAFPTRLEFHDYLEWVAARFAGQTGYGTEVTEIRATGGGELLEVVCQPPGPHNDTERLLARNVVLATGLAPKLPPGVTPSARVWHARDLMTNVADLHREQPKRLAVVGAGQSAAEVLDYLHRTFPAAEVCAVFARFGFSPADDSAFANRIFDPGAVDAFYAAPDDVKSMLMGYHANTNYSVVDPELIEGIYRRHYQEKVAGTERLRFRNVSRVTDVVDHGGHVDLLVESMIDGAREVLTADAVVYATGYRPSDPLWLLDDDIATACVRDTRGRMAIRRDYTVETDALPDGSPLRARLFVQGPTEHTHGISSTLLSNVAVRTGEIVETLRVPLASTADMLIRQGGARP